MIPGLYLVHVPEVESVLLAGLLLPQGLVPAPEVRMLDVDYMSISSPCTCMGWPFHMGSRLWFE